MFNIQRWKVVFTQWLVATAGRPKLAYRIFVVAAVQLLESFQFYTHDDVIVCNVVIIDRKTISNYEWRLVINISSVGTYYSVTMTTSRGFSNAASSCNSFGCLKQFIISTSSCAFSLSLDWIHRTNLAA